MRNDNVNEEANQNSSYSGSDSSCSVSSEQMSNNQLPKITRGLVNLTNTCYMNSVLQCLANTPSVARSCIRITDSNKFDSFCESFCDLVKDLWSSKTVPVYPRDFKFEVNNRLQKFCGYRQHDSHEFLTSLLVTLSDDPKDDHSKLDSIRDFYGEVCRSMNCLDCGNVRRISEEMWSVTVPLHKGVAASPQGCRHLFHFLRVEMSPETMTAENLPFCDKCTRRTNSEFSWVIKRAPKYLIFHLLRFTGPPLNRKIDTKVDFEVDDLDLSQFIDDGLSSYRLYGVINHYGTLNSGHYTAFCRSYTNPDLWFLMNDSNVSQCSSVNVVSNAAYILFYQRVD